MKELIFAARVFGAGMLSLVVGVVLAVSAAFVSPYLPFDIAAHNGWPMVLAIWAVMLWLNGRLLDRTSHWMLGA
jgi:hypothetical protein